MKSLSVQVDDALHTKIKIEVAKEGSSLKSYLTDLIIKDLTKKEQTSL